MGLDVRALGALAATVGFELAGNAKVAVVFHVAAIGTYDPDTDTTDQPATDVPLSVIAYQTKEQQTQLQSQEDSPNAKHLATLLVRAADLPPGVTIDETNTVTHEDAEWGIVEVEPDPSRATLKVTVRR